MIKVLFIGHGGIRMQFRNYDVTSVIWGYIFLYYKNIFRF